MVKRILLVEDDGVIRIIAAEFLRDAGFDVVEAWTGDQAVGFIDRLGPFDMLVTDVRMPGLRDGFAVAIHARMRQVAIPILVISGYADNVRARLDALDPMAVFLSKPFRLEKLAELCGHMALSSASKLIAG